MKQKLTLQEAFVRAEYPVPAHGRRNAGVLKEAFAQVADELDSDMYGSGEVIERFQDKFAALLGKEAAVFFPSGTMAQQIALRIWCDEKGTNRVAYHPLCHLEIHEEDGLRELHRLEPLLLADRERLITLEDVQGIGGRIACLLLELPQREIGGQLPAFEELEAISAYCRKQGIRLHLDGARLLEVLPYYGRTAAQVCELFDSVYISLYKGIGGIAGAILAGDREFTDKSKVWKRRHGGDLISLYPYIVSADYYYNLRADRMEQYYVQARELAGLLNGCAGVRTLPEVPVSNMFHLYFDGSKERIEPVLVSFYEESGIALSSALREAGPDACYCEISIGDRYGQIPGERLHEGIELLNAKMSRLRQGD